MDKKAVYSALFAGASNVVMAQSAAIELGEIDVVDKAVVVKSSTAVEASYESYDPVDSGVSVINEQSIENSRGGGIDTTELLERLPFVQMDDANRGQATREKIQSIRPSDFSISGGNYYDNNIMIDGVSVNSVHDVTNKSESSIDSVAGQTSQTFYVDPSLLGSTEVFDSNVSAKYGGFIGGAVNFKVREPKKEFGMKLRVGYQSDGMVHYKTDKDTLADGEVPGRIEPEFKKYSSSVSFDLPVSERLHFLTAYTRAESNVYYQADEKYGGRTYPNNR